MKQTSILDKLKLVFDLSSKNAFYIGVLCVLVFISILFITTNRKNRKESLKTYGILYFIVALFIGIKFHSSLSTMFDCMMDNLFIVFYFPNISVYLAAIIITNVIIWVTMFSRKSKLGIKIINSLVFLIIHYLLVLNLGIINNEKIDVFNQTSLYGNADVHALIELTGAIFIVWVIFLAIYKVIFSYLDSKNENVKVADKVVEKVTSEPREMEKVAQLPSNIREVSSPFVVKREMTKPVVVYEKPVTPNTAIYEQMLTIDDYKLLLSILREEKAKKKDDISYNPIREVRKQVKTNSVSNEFSKLMDLYSKGF
ncbi:MAG: hypothetical protein J6B89_02045 [Bacilli bacterium]|nr:hypothetical protein [Bacilli bacterium]